MTIRVANESPKKQGVDETIAYLVDTTNWPGTGAISAEADVLKDEAGDDVSGTYLSGSTTASGSDITTRAVAGLVAGHRYRMEVKWTQNSNIFETWWIIEGED
jgi:hypothetical protein